MSYAYIRSLIRLWLQRSGLEIHELGTKKNPLAPRVNMTFLGEQTFKLKRTIGADTTPN